MKTTVKRLSHAYRISEKEGKRKAFETASKLDIESFLKFIDSVINYHKRKARKLRLQDY